VVKRQFEFGDAQQTLQQAQSALNRVNVRRLVVEVKRQVVDIANRMVFEQNTPEVRNKFVSDASVRLGLIQTQFGVESYNVIMDERNNSSRDVLENRVNGKIEIVPTRAIEKIGIDFIITNSGVDFV
jgi:predicted subunit of tRNA(5-methylaminomethyl-2-thiouridylate) methyltransferase